MEMIDRYRGCLLGLACGDAVGTTVEFRARGTFPPVTDMVGGGPFHLRRGEWTDDTSMALCMATSLVERQQFDAHDQMVRFCQWQDDGYLSSNGECFDIGLTVEQALSRFRETGDPFSGSTDPHSAGNGCLMRLAPMPMFFFPNREAAIEYSGYSARTTHGAQECIDATRLLAAILVQALAGRDKETVLLHHGLTALASPGLLSTARGEYRFKQRRDIRGTGYVVDSLEAALWCFAQTNTFEDAILCAANLGGDADTTAAICGQVAGAFYGASRIPGHWVQRLAMADEIRTLAEQLYATAQSATIRSA